VKATLAVITSFVGKTLPSLPPLMSWEQIREPEKTGLVEIASHSHDLHRFETNNPYRDTGPSVATRRYILKDARYKYRDEYRERVLELIERKAEGQEIKRPKHVPGKVTDLMEALRASVENARKEKASGGRGEEAEEEEAEAERRAAAPRASGPPGQ